MERSIFVFTFRNKVTFETTPIALVSAPTLSGAEQKVRKYFPKYLFELCKSMQITNKNFVAILSYDNINLQKFLYDDDD